MNEKVTIPGDIHVDPKNLEQQTTQNETNSGWMQSLVALGLY